VRVVVLENTARGVNGTMDLSLIAQVGHVERSNDIGANGYELAVFAPINVGGPEPIPNPHVGYPLTTKSAKAEQASRTTKRESQQFALALSRRRVHPVTVLVTILSLVLAEELEKGFQQISNCYRHG
jgi:hypothetical protein